MDAVPIAVHLPDGIKIEYKFSPADVTKVRHVGEEGRHGVTQERIKVVTRVRACNSNRRWSQGKIEHWSSVLGNINKMAYFYPSVQCMLLFLVLAEIPPGFKFYIVTRSYSTRPFLCTLLHHIVVTIILVLYCKGKSCGYRLQEWLTQWLISPGKTPPSSCHEKLPVV